LYNLADQYRPLSSMDASGKFQAFGMWLGIVYVNRTDPLPQYPEGVKIQDDPSVVLQFHDDYEAGDWRMLDRGLTLEEGYLGLQYTQGTEFVCIISSAAPPQPTERIKHKLVLSSDTALEMAALYFRRKAGRRRKPLAALVFDGHLGHAITLMDLDPISGKRFAFWDPWPGRSLLCEENNADGVKVSPLGTNKLHFPERSIDIEEWEIARNDLERILVAFQLPLAEWSELIMGMAGQPFGGLPEHVYREVIRALEAQATPAREQAKEQTSAPRGVMARLARRIRGIR
jgi:hypothetical protein